jgi:predicted amidohydrolase
MSAELRIACVQMSSGPAKAANLETAARLVRRAATEHANVVVLPETWNGVGTADDLQRLAEPLAGESAGAMAGWAREHRVWIVGGSITERRGGHERLSNTCCVFDPDGAMKAVYRKIHLFDVELDGHTYRESDVIEPGAVPVVSEVAGWRTGLAICYDLRFPELFRHAAAEGAQLVALPANFALRTGKDHWHVLLQARAVENQCYVAAAAQIGKTLGGRDSFGHSVVIDPWGTVIADARHEETVVVATLDRQWCDHIRAMFPALQHRRLSSPQVTPAGLEAAGSDGTHHLTDHRSRVVHGRRY